MVHIIIYSCRYMLYHLYECRTKAPRTEALWTKARKIKPPRGKSLPNLTCVFGAFVSCGLLSLGLLSAPPFVRVTASQARPVFPCSDIFDMFYNYFFSLICPFQCVNWPRVNNYVSLFWIIHYDIYRKK